MSNEKRVYSLLKSEKISVGRGEDGANLCSIPHNENKEVYNINSYSFRIAFKSFWKKEYGELLNDKEVQEIISIIEVECYESKNKIQRNHRIYTKGRMLIYQLNTDNNTSVRIEDGECEIEETPDFMFYTDRNFKNQVEPDLNVVPEELLPYIRKHFNVKDEDDVILISILIVSSMLGMRHLENIWRGNELAWSTGYTESVHGCPTSSAHYASMMGKTIDSIEYYTTNGLYTIDVNDLYVLVKFAKTEDAVKVVDADISAGKTAIELNLRDDFDPEYTVEGLNVKVEGNVLTFKADSSINPGKYTLTVKDKNGKYADLKTTFILSTTDMPATYDADNKKLTVAENSNKEAFNTYIGNITSVNVNGTDYAASGRGSVKIIDKDGTLVTDAAPFKDAAAGTEFQITVTSTGYTTPLAFTYKVPGETPAPSEVDTTKLAAAIEKAEGLNESDYTKDSWKALQSELTKAKSALEAKESQDTVDKAADSLNKAIDALETATPDEPTKEVSTDALEKAMKAAGALKESDYTADSWKALQSALAEADTALKEKKNQDTVDKATEKLNKAISALVKKDAGQKVNGTDGTNGTSGKSGKTGSTSNTKSGKAAKTGDPSGMFAWLGLAVTSLGAGIGGFSLKRKKREDEE